MTKDAMQKVAQLSQFDEELYKVGSMDESKFKRAFSLLIF